MLPIHQAVSSIQQQSISCHPTPIYLSFLSLKEMKPKQIKSHQKSLGNYLPPLAPVLQKLNYFGAVHLSPT